jgi:hypothetical protein
LPEVVAAVVMQRLTVLYQDLKGVGSAQHIPEEVAVLAEVMGVLVEL